MNAIAAINMLPVAPRAAADIARELGAVFAQRANETTDEDKFVADNFALLKTSGLVEAGVLAELGGGIGNGACRRRRLLSNASLERRFRDIQAARYHPLQSGPQAQFAGAMALGLPVDRIF